MKKQLLLVALLLTGKAFSQSFTQSNEASVGSSVSMYVCDSLTPNYASTKGSNAVWDFSNLSIPDTLKKSLISVVDPKTTKYNSLYSTSDKAIVFENFLTSYYSSTSNNRSCVGYFFSNSTLGDVRAVFNSDPEITHTYPFGVNAIQPDNLSGKLYYNYLGQPVTPTPTATGSSLAEVDALGTLKIDANQVFKNVLRYHIKDSVYATVNIPPFGVLNALLKRDQYEYYDLTISNLPIYTYSNLKAFAQLSPDPLLNKTIVLSKYKGDKNAKPVDSTNSINETQFSKFSIYPNPAKNILYLLGENTDNVSISILDQSGKTINTYNYTNSLNIEHLEKGIYLFQIKGENGIEVMKFVKE